MFRHAFPWRVALYAALALLVVSCGFHLRGALKWPERYDAVHIQGPYPYHPFALELERTLRVQGVRLTNAAQARVMINVIEERFDRQVATLTTGGGVRDFELHYQVRFGVRGQGDRTLLVDQSIDVVQVYGTETGQVLAKSQEEEQLYLSMRQNAVQQLLARLRKLAAEPSPEVAP